MKRDKERARAKANDKAEKITSTTKKTSITDEFAMPVRQATVKNTSPRRVVPPMVTTPTQAHIAVSTSQYEHNCPEMAYVVRVGSIREPKCMRITH